MAFSPNITPTALPTVFDGLRFPSKLGSSKRLASGRFSPPALLLLFPSLHPDQPLLPVTFFGAFFFELIAVSK